MNESVIARRYARGLAEYAHEQGKVADVRTDLGKLNDMLDPEAGDVSAPELIEFLRSPTVPPADKIRITDSLCDKLEIGPIVSNFLNVLIQRARTSLMPFIYREFIRFAGRYDERKTAYVETARPLDEAQTEKLRAALTKVADSTIELKVRVNEKLIAGVRVQMDDDLLDGTYARQLDRLADTFKQG